MGYFYAIERKKFEDEMVNFRQEAQAAGMREKDIEEIYAFSKNQFNRDRAFYTRRQSMDATTPSDRKMTEKKHSALLKKFQKQLSVCQPEISTWSRSTWIEDLDTPELTQWLKSLSSEDQELVSMIVVEDLSQADLARRLNVSRAAVSKKIARLRKSFKAWS